MSVALNQVSPPFVEQLKKALKQQLQDAGINADVDAEPAGGTKLYRFFVISDDFQQLSHSERQGVVWRIAQKELQPSDQVKISMILTLTQDENGSPSW